MNIFFAILISVLIGFSLLISYLKTLKKNALEEWSELLTALQKRSDLLPLFIELIRQKTIKIDSTSFAEIIPGIIQLRIESWKINECNGLKVSKELELSTKVKKLIEMSNTNPELAKDYLYLALKKELSVVGANIESFEEKYNEKVRQLNKYFGISFVKPVLEIFNLRPLLIFEFEN